MTTISSLTLGMPRLLALMVAVWYGATAFAQAEELRLRAQLIWGTDEAKPGDAKCKEVDPAVLKKLCRVFKWKNYFEISQQQVGLSGRESKRLKMSSKCEIEVRFVDDATLEIKLFGEGKLTKTVRQSVKALAQGELAVLAGDDKDKYNDAWFVVLTSPPRQP